MRTAEIYRNGLLCGLLLEEDQRGFVFRYDEAYFHDTHKPAISLTIPKTKQEHRSKFLFPFFFNMLSEGVNKKLQSVQLKIDEADSFGLLMATARYDTIGAITVKPAATK